MVNKRLFVMSFIYHVGQVKFDGIEEGLQKQGYKGDQQSLCLPSEQYSESPDRYYVDNAGYHTLYFTREQHTPYEVARMLYNSGFDGEINIMDIADRKAYKDGVPAGNYSYVRNYTFANINDEPVMLFSPREYQIG